MADDASIIIRKAQALPFYFSFEEFIQTNFDLMSNKVGSSTEHLICSLLPTIAHLMGKSCIKFSENFTQGFSFYVCLAAADESTSAMMMMDWVKESYFDLELFLGVNSNESKFVTAVNATALISQLEKANGNTLSLFGEESGFLKSFSMLKRGNKQLKCFYRGVFCELANASDDFRHDTKEKRICIKQPRVNVAVNFAPRRWLQFIRDDVQAFGDGLIHRFHFCSPSPITIEQRGGVKRLADDLQEPEFCLSALFLFVFNLNKSAKMFEFESEAKEFLRKRANEFRSQAQSSQSDFLSAVYYKSDAQLMRLTGVIHSIEKAGAFLQHYAGNKVSLSPQLAANIEQHIRLDEENLTKISISSIVKADKMLAYFTNQKLIFLSQ